MSPAERPHSQAAPRVAALLPAAYLAHLVEEWFGGFSAWTLEALGREVGTERFVLINAAALVLFTAGAWLSWRSPRHAWIAVALAALLGLNGILHLLATVGLGRYSPGTVTGLALYLPLSAAVLRRSRDRLPSESFTRAVLVGVAAHAVVAIVAFV